MKKTDSKESGILLLTKKSGCTSFSSLWSVKHALETQKVGHTGTLDSFAEGLLVVLSGHLTHLVPHITAFTKTYQAVVCFGKQTDTLDPTGSVIKTSSPVTRENLEKALPLFCGPLLQTPPAYSALHVNGKRASDIARSGCDVNLQKRQVFIYSLKLKDFLSESDGASYALIEVCCSKGTYIRALARDIAQYCQSCAFLCALRRTQVGPFLFSEAALSNTLEPFTIEYGKRLAASFFKASKNQSDSKKTFDKEESFAIKRHFMHFTSRLASLCGFDSFLLKEKFLKQYLNGRPLNEKMFTLCESSSKDSLFYKKDQKAVFYEDGSFGGMVSVNEESKVFYSFVVPWKKKSLRIFSWDDVVNGVFPLELKNSGCAVTVGGFDGMHSGHQALVSCIKKQALYSGIVTFKTPFKSRSCNYEGNVISLEQKLDLCRNSGVDFAVVIDFSDEFSKMDGQDFIKILVSSLGMKVLAEGSDFKCGEGGKCSMEHLSVLASSLGFELKNVPFVFYKQDRVSSSLVRQKILQADFNAVQNLLLRPFVYDIRGMSFTCGESLKDGTWFKWERSLQVLPKNGSYDVIAFFEEQKLHCLCRIEDSGIELFLPTERVAQKVYAVEFYATNT